MSQYKRVVEKINEAKVKDVKKNYTESGVWRMDWSLPVDIQEFLIKWKDIYDANSGRGGGIKW